MSSTSRRCAASVVATRRSACDTSTWSSDGTVSGASGTAAPSCASWFDTVMSPKAEARREPRVDEDFAAECTSIDDETDITDATVRGDFSATELYLVSIRQCRVDNALFTGSRLVRASFVDCVIVDSDLSGVRLEDCRLE